MVGQRTLNPFIMVRIHVPQPANSVVKKTPNIELILPDLVHHR